MICKVSQIKGRRVIGCALTLLMLAFSAEALADGQYRVATVPEKTLRKWAKVVVMPTYPPESKKNNAQGVVVAELSIDETGTVKKVEILESPDDAIGKAVTNATKQWKFEPAIDDSTGKAIRLAGKLTFYFVIEGTAAYVRNPK
jgi:TonB family protein